MGPGDLGLNWKIRGPLVCSKYTAELHVSQNLLGLTLLHSERPNLYGVLAALSAIRLNLGFVLLVTKNYVQ